MKISKSTFFTSVFLLSTIVFFSARSMSQNQNSLSVDRLDTLKSKEISKAQKWLNRASTCKTNGEKRLFLVLWFAENNGMNEADLSKSMLLLEDDKLEDYWGTIVKWNARIVATNGCKDLECN